MPLSICLGVLLSISGSYGERIIDENFESYDLETPIEGSQPDDVAPGAWATVGLDIPGASAVVVEGESTNGSGENQRVLHIVRPLEPTMNFRRDFSEITADSAPNGVRVSMKFKVEDLEESSDLVFGLLERPGKTFGTTSIAGMFRLRFQPPNNSRFYYRVAGSSDPSGAYESLPEFSFIGEHWYELVLTLNLAGQTWDFELRNLDTGELASMADIPLDREVQSVSGIGLCNRTPPAAMNHFFDDIVVEILE